MYEPHIGGDYVDLVVPATPEMWAIVRMTATALATGLDFSVDAIADLRLAVTELCASVGADAAKSARCECRFEMSSSELELHCKVGPVKEAPPKAKRPQLITAPELSRQILDATVDRYEIGGVHDETRAGHLHKVRAASTY